MYPQIYEHLWETYLHLARGITLSHLASVKRENPLPDEWDLAKRDSFWHAMAVSEMLNPTFSQDAYDVRMIQSSTVQHQLETAVPTQSVFTSEPSAQQQASLPQQPLCRPSKPAWYVFFRRFQRALTLITTHRDICTRAVTNAPKRPSPLRHVTLLSPSLGQAVASRSDLALTEKRMIGADLMEDIENLEVPSCVEDLFEAMNRESNRVWSETNCYPR